MVVESATYFQNAFDHGKTVITDFNFIIQNLFLHNFCVYIIYFIAN